MEFDSKPARRPNPRETTNPVSAFFFLHIIPMFLRLHKKKVTEDDLFDALQEDKSSKLGEELELLWNKKRLRYKRYALHLALIQRFGLELISAASVMTMAQIAIIVATPYSISGLVSYFQNGPNNGNENDAYYYAVLTISVILLRNIIGHPGLMWASHICMKMRVACCALIYRKSLRLSPKTLSQTTIGQMVNLLSNDMNKFDQRFMYWHYILSAPLQSAVGSYCLYLAIGKAAFYGLGFMVLVVPIQIFLGKLNSKLRLKTAIRTDERLRLMNEILSGIKVIKMYSWELPFAKLISAARSHEIKATRAHFYVEAVFQALEMFVTRTAVFITIIIFLSLGNTISASTVYLITANYSIMRTIVTTMFPVSISAVAEIHISISRVQKFLNLDELQEREEIESILIESPKIVLKGVDVKWFAELPDFALQNIDFNIDKSQLLAVVGPVGSGKTTLLNVILKELAITSGNLEVSGKVSYASQEPWLFSGTIRQNILFGSKYDETRYKCVLNVCALEYDLGILTFGDQTIISDSGKSLSGGQKARISLARCIYRIADIYLLDDPLSAVDTNVGKHLFEKCIKNFLGDKICILVTHQLQHVEDADTILILTNGKILGRGTYKELKGSGLDFAALLGSNLRDEQTVIKKIPTDSKLNEIVKMSSKQNEKTEETIDSGSIAAKAFFQYLKTGGNYCYIAFLLIIVLTAYATGSFGDYFVAYWVNMEQRASHNTTFTKSTYFTRETAIYIYSGIIGATIILAFGCSRMFFVFFMCSSVNLHNIIFEKVSFAAMKFFDSNPIGRILNRFSNDMGVLDEYIPLMMSDVLKTVFPLVAVSIMAYVVNPWIIVGFVVLFLLCYKARLFYIGTSRSIKRIEAMARSPIYNHIIASVSGLPTIRAFEVQKLLINEFDAHQDRHSSAWYIFFSFGRAFASLLDLICVSCMAIIIFCLLFIYKGYQGGDVGLILTQYLSLIGILQWGVRQWCELENNVVSIERILEYRSIETEPERKGVCLLQKNWPEYGKIVFQDVSLKYDLSGPNILKHLNFTINPQAKIGIVGRTGAGKTSIITALLQLYNIEGSIIIDDVDITKLPFHDFRAKISIIPQEPVLFSGTIRKNLDPLEEYSDLILWTALDRVELKQVIETTTAGLNTTVAECGANFSIGQKQLVCLARAIIRNNKILVMDEATANVDPYTDAIIQKTLRREFASSTVITIAHRLHTIMDSDKVLVMQNGTMVEFDNPEVLLRNANGIFYKMAHTISHEKSLSES